MGDDDAATTAAFAAECNLPTPPGQELLLHRGFVEAISPPSEIATPLGCISAPLGSMIRYVPLRMHTTCTPRVHSLLPVHLALPYLGRSNCGICVMRESLSEELRAEVRTRNLRRVVLLGVTFGTRGVGYGVRVRRTGGVLFRFTVVSCTSIDL